MPANSYFVKPDIKGRFLSGFFLLVARVVVVQTCSECDRARSITPAGANPAPAKLVSHRIASIGQAEVTPDVKHDVRKAAVRKRKLK